MGVDLGEKNLEVISLIYILLRKMYSETHKNSLEKVSDAYMGFYNASNTLFQFK